MRLLATHHRHPATTAHQPTSSPAQPWAIAQQHPSHGCTINTGTAESRARMRKCGCLSGLHCWFYQQQRAACSWSHFLRQLTHGSVCTGRNGVSKNSHRSMAELMVRPVFPIRQLQSCPAGHILSNRWTFRRWKSSPSFPWWGFIALLTSLLIYVLDMLTIAFSISCYGVWNSKGVYRP